MYVKFVGDPIEKELDLPPSKNGLDWFGKSFRLGAPVDISDLTSAQKTAIGRNSHFEVVETPAAEEPKKPAKTKDA